MVTIVAALLSFVAVQLRPIQEKNVEIVKKTDILRSVRMAEDLSEVKNRDRYIEQLYDEVITESCVIDPEGNKREGVDAFEVNMKEELAKPPEKRNLPVFIFSSGGGEYKFIFPLRGKGLWGPIWGYISFHEDMTTVYGVNFSHEKETPGLGAEIATDMFESQFRGKLIFDEQGKFVSIEVSKKDVAGDNKYAVDAISGGTITSTSVEEMLKACLDLYVPYFKKSSDHE